MFQLCDWLESQAGTSTVNEGDFEKLTSLGAVVLEFYSLPRFALGRDSACVGAGAVG